MERLSVLFHHYVIASHWAGMQGSCEDLADEWVGVHLDCDLRYGTNDSDLRACYVSGMAKMIGAKRKMQLDALLLEFDAEREEFGDFFVENIVLGIIGLPMKEDVKWRITTGGQGGEKKSHVERLSGVISFKVRKKDQRVFYDLS